MIRVSKNVDLEKLIEKAFNSPPMTEAQIAEQRESFVRAEAGFGSDADEAAYSAAVLSRDQDQIERLDRESQRRIDALTYRNPDDT